MINWAEDLNTSGSMYYDEYRLWGRRLQANGSIVPGTSPFEITVTDPTQPYNRLTAEPGGGLYLAGWQWEAQRILADGDLSGSEIPITDGGGPFACGSAIQEYQNCWGGPRLVSGGASPNDLLIAWAEESGGLFSVRGLPVGPVPLEGIAIAAVISSGLLSPARRTCERALSQPVCAQSECGDPINTVTGGFDYSWRPHPTIAGPLVFQRSYSSLCAACTSSSSASAGPTTTTPA
jgi:hypothetical protein